jgi:hypothetical protein
VEVGLWVVGIFWEHFFFIMSQTHYGGLKEMHIKYWKASTGADTESKLSPRRFLNVLRSAKSVVSFVLCLCLKVMLLVKKSFVSISATLT